MNHITTHDNLKEQSFIQIEFWLDEFKIELSDSPLIHRFRSSKKFLDNFCCVDLCNFKIVLMESYFVVYRQYLV